MRIIADTATLYSPAEGEKMGMTVIPVCVAIDGNTYKDYEEISSAEFLKQIQAGGVPSSSQPALGDVLEVLEESNEETILLTVADGLSGAYQTAQGAKSCMADSEHIHVINSKTLAGPLRYLARKALTMKKEGCSVSEIKAALAESIESSLSFVIPADFEFLKRSGRLTPVAAKIGGAMKLIPVLTQTRDKLRIKPIAVKRSWKAALDVILNRLQSSGVGAGYCLSVSHAGAHPRAVSVLRQLKAAFPGAETEILELSPALMTHGGPGCIVVQAIRK